MIDTIWRITAERLKISSLWGRVERWPGRRAVRRTQQWDERVGRRYNQDRCTHRAAAGIRLSDFIVTTERLSSWRWLMCFTAVLHCWRSHTDLGVLSRHRSKVQLIVIGVTVRRQRVDKVGRRVKVCCNYTKQSMKHWQLPVALQVWLQCFDTVGWATGRTSGLQKAEWWYADWNFARLRELRLSTLQQNPG